MGCPRCTLQGRDPPVSSAAGPGCTMAQEALGPAVGPASPLGRESCSSQGAGRWPNSSAGHPQETPGALLVLHLGLSGWIGQALGASLDLAQPPEMAPPAPQAPFLVSIPLGLGGVMGSLWGRKLDRGQESHLGSGVPVAKSQKPPLGRHLTDNHLSHLMDRVTGGSWKPPSVQ